MGEVTNLERHLWPTSMIGAGGASWPDRSDPAVPGGVVGSEAEASSMGTQHK